MEHAPTRLSRTALLFLGAIALAILPALIGCGADKKDLATVQTKPVALIPAPEPVLEVPPSG
ncbi:MAG: hypothetical protein ABIJ56_17450 [Pseudomonadota bacterium]